MWYLVLMIVLQCPSDEMKSGERVIQHPADADLLTLCISVFKITASHRSLKPKLGRGDYRLPPPLSFTQETAVSVT